MKKHVPTIAGVLLGLMFLAASVPFLLNLVPMPKLVEGSPEAMFMGAFGPTGYMTFVKICELTGAILVAIPRTRGLGLLVLGPIIVNILAYSVFIQHGKGLINPMLGMVVVCALYLLYVERKKFAGLVRL